MCKTASPNAACKAILRQALRGWQALRAADNVGVVVVQLAWSTTTTTTPPGKQRNSSTTMTPAPGSSSAAGASAPAAGGSLRSGSLKSLAEGKPGAVVGCRGVVDDGGEVWRKLEAQAGGDSGSRAPAAALSRVVQPSRGPGSFVIMECEA